MGVDDPEPGFSGQLLPALVELKRHLRRTARYQESINGMAHIAFVQ